MAKKCPECGYNLKFYNFRAECPKCNTNIPNYNWQERLENDADEAELAYAKLHYKTKNFKSAVFGSKLRIARFILTFAPIIAFLLPLYNFKLSMPFREETTSVSFLSLLLDYILKTDIGSVITLLGNDVLGNAASMIVIAALLLIFAVVCGVLNFFVILFSGFKMRYVFNIALNVLSTVSFASATIFFTLFTNACTQLGGGIITECSLGYGFIVGIILFAINLTLNIIVGKGLKKQMATQPSLDEFVENELNELHA